MHTTKWLLICNANKQILFLSPIFEGTTHDFEIFKQIFLTYNFALLSIWVDLGFLGIAKMVDAKQIYIPHKASKKHPLTKSQKETNCTLSRFRVVVENTLSGVKRYQILCIKNRMHSQNKRDESMEICTNLWNFKIKCKKIKVSN